MAFKFSVNVYGVEIVEEAIDFPDRAFQIRAIISGEGVPTETPSGIVWSEGVWGHLPSD